METTETTPAVKLRSSVVLLVIRAIVGLAGALLLIIAFLLFTHRMVPGELWLAFGNLTGALTALLINSKHQQDGPVAVDVQNTTDNPVPTEPQPPIDPPVEDPPVDPPVEPKKRK